MSQEPHFSIAPDHPSLAGHFPGRPIVPGVVVLERALALLLRDRPGHRVAALDEVKFLAPVLPGDAIVVEVAEATTLRLTFVASADQRVVLRCRARLGLTR